LKYKTREGGAKLVGNLRMGNLLAIKRKYIKWF